MREEHKDTGTQTAVHTRLWLRFLLQRGFILLFSFSDNNLSQWDFASRWGN